MRDIILVVFLFFAIYYSFKRPFIGVAAWVWIALMAPAQWAFGFSQSFRLNLTIVIVAFLSYLVARKKPHFEFTSLHTLVFLFLFWMLVATIFHLRIDSTYAWDKFIEFTKVVMLFLFITLAIDTKKKVDTFVWAIVLAISAYAAMEAIKFILSGGGHRIVGKSGILADRNDLAVAINMCLPLVFYLWHVTKHKYLKLGLLGLGFLNVIAIVGTFSRGGFIGLSILAFAIWLKSNYKFVFFVLALIALPVAYQNAPSEWKERQSTIQTASTEDSSFIGRLWAWKIATLIALDNPATGGGFKATTDPVLWQLYAPDTMFFGPIETPPIPVEIRPKAAHNIYFQVLASSGFVGLFLFLLMLLVCYVKNFRNGKIAEKLGLDWISYLSKCINLSLIGYGITGMNVSLAYFDLVYAIFGVISVVTVIVANQQKKMNGLRSR